ANGLTQINQTLTAFAQPLQVSASCRNEWDRQGRTIGVVYFEDDVGPWQIDNARKIHAGWVHKYVELRTAETALLDVLLPGPATRIDRTTAVRMITTLFAALGMKKNDEENAMLLASAAEMFSPLDGLIGGVTRLWTPINTHPLVLALAVKTLIASAKFTSCAELREAMEKVRHSIELKHWALEYLTTIIDRTHQIVFEHDRPSWQAHYATVDVTVVTAIRDTLVGIENPYTDDDDVDQPGSPRWQALSNLVQAK